jgi:hypothetical protein
LQAAIAVAQSQKACRFECAQRCLWRNFIARPIATSMRIVLAPGIKSAQERADLIALLRAAGGESQRR